MAEKVFKNSIKVEITDKGGHSFTVNDAEIAGVGSSVYAQLLAEPGVIFQTGDNTMTYIPFCSVCHAEITTTREETDAPEDETCKEEA